MPHDRKLALGGVSHSKKKLTSAQTVLAMGRVRDKIEAEMVGSGYLEGAPFKWVGLVIRQGVVDQLEPNYKKIDNRDGELPLAIEVNVEHLASASGDEAEGVYRAATLRALLHAGEKYGLDVARIRALLNEGELRTSSIS